MTVVVDANILIAFALLDEPLHTQANQILAVWQKTNEALIAPQLFRSEITAVVRKTVYQQRITVEQGRGILSDLLTYKLDFYEDDDLLREAYELAVRFNRPRAYDSQYMALAQRFNCEFWTSDERLVNSVYPQFQLIRWLGSWKQS
jgi:predicted nucleic acid-binding protein